MNDLLTIQQASVELGISRSRVHALIAAGRLPATKVGSYWLIERGALEAVRVRKPGRPWPAKPTEPEK